MRIVYCILGTYNSGGMERVLSNKANYLSRTGFDVSIVTTDQRGRSPFFCLEPSIKLYDLGINYTDGQGLGIVSKILSYYKKQRKHRQKLSKLLKELRADIVISMFDHDAQFLYEIQDGSKKILEIHFSRFKRLQYGNKGIWGLVDVFRNRKDLTIVKKYDRFVVLTEEDRGYWQGVNNICVIPNANAFSPIEKAKLENKKVIAVGRLDYQKGFDYLIKAWKFVHCKHPDWTLKIYGEGPLHQALSFQISMWNLEKVVYLMPPTSEIEKAYLDSSLLVMTSRYEGLPMALLEAQACGIPMVSFACKCGPKDIIHDGLNGFLVDEGDLVGLSTKICQVLENEEIRKKMGQTAAEYSLNFEEDRIMSQWINLFENLR